MKEETKKKLDEYWQGIKRDEYGQRYIEEGGPKKVIKRRVYLDRYPPNSKKELKSTSVIWFRELSDRFHLVRISSRLTQQELAKKIGSTQAFISAIECGRANPSVEFIDKLAKQLNLKITLKLD